jgi:tripartite-type tricarboxylate transporter receptor subunit TctC
VLMLPIALGATPATAQDYPTKPITMIVGFAPGGFADSLARIVADKLSERLGQNVIVENRGGAGGNIAAAAVAKAPPDGYTILVTTTGIAFYEVVTRNKSFSVDDLKPIAIPGSAPETLSVNSGHPAKTLAEFIAGIEGKSITFASPGPGTPSHIAASYFFKELAKRDAVHVPFQGGAPAVNAVIGGHVEALTGALPGYAGQLRSGAIRGLAIASDRRLPQFPDIPTYAEGGFPTFTASTWVGFFAPGKTSDAIATKLNGEINDVLRLPDVRERLAAYFIQINHRTQPETVAFFKGETETWRQMITAIGFTLD